MRAPLGSPLVFRTARPLGRLPLRHRHPPDHRCSLFRLSACARSRAGPLRHRSLSLFDEFAADLVFRRRSDASTECTLPDIVSGRPAASMLFTADNRSGSEAEAKEELAECGAEAREEEDGLSVELGSELTAELLRSPDCPDRRRRRESGTGTDKSTHPRHEHTAHTHTHYSRSVTTGTLSRPSSQAHFCPVPIRRLQRTLLRTAA